MATPAVRTVLVYGASDDLVEFDGDISDEFNRYGKTTTILADGQPILTVAYGPNGKGFWSVTPILPTPDGISITIHPALGDDEAVHPDTPDIPDYTDYATVTGPFATLTIDEESS